MSPSREKKSAPLDLPVRYISGIGTKKAEAFERAGVRTLRDLLYYVPRRYIDRTSATPIGQIAGETAAEVTLIGRILDARAARMRGGRERYEALLDDGSGQITLVWFRRVNQIKKWIQPGFTAVFSGKVNRFGPKLQIAHPEVMSLAKGEAQDLARGEGRWVALYPGGKEFEKVGLDARGLRNLMDRLVGQHIAAVGEIWPEEWLQRLELLTRKQALDHVHRPHNTRELADGWRRLKFDELIQLQLLWAWTRRRNREKGRGIAYPRVGETTRELIGAKLPFKLTEAQRRVLREIWGDMSQPHPMSRLLQGDVGSGKTVVALVAMSIAVENGYQAALMAPTEILAEQHYLTSKKFLDDLEVPVQLLTGGSRAAARKEALAKTTSGQPMILIGTHALIQDKVSLPRLGLSVIDEQHRFGVAQRMKLMDPGLDPRPDVLVMTATPIPRSLALTLYGDLDVSRLDEMPPGRGKITTKAYNGESDRIALYRKLRRTVESGGRAYVVFPLVEESEKLDLQAAQQGREELLAGPFKGLEVGLLHGRMKVEEKAEAMRRFASGETPVLVSTTVIEVGVDVPEATEMVVEHAERFGLAQLHQLRGRVGRGGRDGHCHLVAYPPVSETARARIKTMLRTTDGFLVAEEDLRLRGAGDLFGIKQHGLPPLRFANLVEDRELLLRAREIADELMNSDPTLENLPALKREFEQTALKRADWLEVG